MFRILRMITLVALFGGITYIWHEPIRIFSLQTYHRIAPCTIPITYSIGSIDPRFNLSKETLLSDIDAATGVWQKLGGDLFAYREEGGLVRVNLVYDKRQETTEKLRELGLEIHEDRASYDAVKRLYETKKSAYTIARNAFDLDEEKLRSRIRTYEADVRRANARGGATREEYERLTREEKLVHAEQVRLEGLRKEVNALASDINALVATLNRLAEVLHESSALYNTVGRDQEFEEGVFVSKPGSQEIVIYEFDSKTRLVRVLAHEFGHAIGLEHVDGGASIMNHINESLNLTPTAEDIAEFKRACRAA